MGKKKSSKQPSEEDVKPAPAAIRPNKRLSRLVVPMILIASAAIGAYLLIGRTRTPSTKFKTGPVNACQKVPQFVRALGFGNSAAFTTADRKIPGLVLIEGERKYQHPSWKAAGSLAPITRNGTGDTFVGPAPWIDVLENKAEEQNRVYRIDGKSQQMIQFADLPRVGAVTSQNPYGTLGLTFDCDTESMYVSSVAGSTRDSSNGRVFQLNKSGQVLSTLDSTDAMGIGVFNTAKGKRLFFGLTRVSEIWSIALDDTGAFTGDARKEVSLSELGPRGDDRARRINFTPQSEMVVFGVEFSYNLIAPTEKQETVYTFRYDASKDVWNFVSPPPQVVEAQ